MRIIRRGKMAHAFPGYALVKGEAGISVIIKMNQ